MFDNHPLEHDELKGQHEKAIVERFIERYNEANKTNFVFKQRGKPPVPDFEYKDSTTSEVIGLEVTGVYYDEHHAKGTWQVVRGKIKKSESNIVCNPTERLREFIEDSIAKKCQKFSYPIILVLDSTRPPLHDVRDIQDIEGMVRQVQLPEKIPFQKIYFGIELELGQYRIWKLYPRKSD